MSAVISIFTEVAPAALGAITAVAVSSFVVFVDVAKTKWRGRFRQQLKLALARGQLTFPDLQHMAERWGQDRLALLQSLRVLLAEALAGESELINNKASSIRSLLEQHESREPYAELPENISLQLFQLSQMAPDSSRAIAQLAASLSELYSLNQREVAKQKKLSFWGFVIGVIGLMLSVPGLYIAFKT